MYRCEKCKELTKPNEKQRLVVTSRRNRVYKDVLGFPIGHGWEIEKESKLCAPCAAPYEEKKVA